MSTIEIQRFINKHIQFKQIKMKTVLKYEYTESPSREGTIPSPAPKFRVILEVVLISYRLFVFKNFSYFL